MTKIDHPIFTQSIKIIQSKLGRTELEPLQQKVLERLIHTSGDFSIKSFLKFSPNACEIGVSALRAGAPILTDTSMAMAGVIPMSARTLSSKVRCVLEWAPNNVQHPQTRSEIGMKKAWQELSREFVSPTSPIVLIGSAPSALNALLDLIAKGFEAPSLIIGMPVGFVGVLESKDRLSKLNSPQIRLDGHRGGASLSAAVVNSLLRSAVLAN